MPVLVTAAGAELGQAVVRAVAASGGEVRAFAGPGAPVALLRAAGAVVATGSLLDEAHLETAMEQVHTVVHLALRLDVDPARLVDESATVARAADGAGVRRLIVVTAPEPAGDDELRAARTAIEEVHRGGAAPVVVLRPSLVDTSDLRRALARTPLPREALATPVAPVRVADVAAAVAWLDDQRAVAVEEALAADGPETTDLGSYLRRVGVTPLSMVGRALGRLRGHERAVRAASLAGAWVSPPGAASVWQRSGLRPSAVEATR